MRLHVKTTRLPCHSMERCGRNDTPFDFVIATFLDELVKDMTPACNSLGKKTENEHNVHKKIMRAFGVCMSNMVYFDLAMASVENWFRLYATAIRCSVEPCERGFVFVGWSGTKSNETWGHSTTLYFDVPSKKQVFLDPSRYLTETVEAGNVLQHFSRHHVWLPKSKSPTVEVNRRCHDEDTPCGWWTWMNTLACNISSAPQCTN